MLHLIDFIKSEYSINGGTTNDLFLIKITF